MSARLAALRRHLVQPWILIPIAVVVALGVWFGFFRSTSSGSAATPTATATERTVTVTRGTLQQTITASGTIEAASTEDLNFSAAGTVTAVNVKAGDTVKAGQALATIDSAQLQASVQQAQETVDTAQSKLDTDEDDSATSAQLTADRANLASAKAQLTLAQQNLAGATLTSPIAGTVAEVNLSVGQQLGSGGTSGEALTGSGTGSGRSASSTSSSGGSGGGATGGSSQTSSPQIEVISTGSYVVTLNLDTTDIANVKAGQTALVTPTTSSSSSGTRGFGGPGGAFAGPGGFGGTSTNRSASSSSSTGTTAGQQVSGKVTSVGVIAQASSGVASFPVEVTVSGSSSAFHAGAVANVAIVYNEVADALEVPSLAVDRTGSSPTVTVVADGKHETRTVTLGITSGNEVQVLSGLDEGDTVVVALPGAAGRTTRQNGSGSENQNGRSGFGGGELPGGGGFPGGGG